MYRNSHLVLLCTHDAQLKQHLTFHSLFNPSKLMSVTTVKTFNSLIWGVANKQACN